MLLVYALYIQLFINCFDFIIYTSSTIRGGGDVTYLSPFWERTARKSLLPGTYLTNPLIKCDKLGASLPTV